jgi:hypothetical protein
MQSKHIRSNDGAETSTLHSDVAIALEANSRNLRTDVFSLSITIGPNHKQVGSSRFGLEIALDLFKVL